MTQPDTTPPRPALDITDFATLSEDEQVRRVTLFLQRVFAATDAPQTRREPPSE